MDSFHLNCSNWKIIFSLPWYFIQRSCSAWCPRQQRNSGTQSLGRYPRVRVSLLTFDLHVFNLPSPSVTTKGCAVSAGFNLRRQNHLMTSHSGHLHRKHTVSSRRKPAAQRCLPCHSSTLGLLPLQLNQVIPFRLLASQEHIFNILNLALSFERVLQQLG